MLTQFTIGFSRTINLGNYESARVEASVTMEVEHRENLPMAEEVAQKELRRLLEETWKAQLKYRKETYVPETAK